MAKTVKHMPTRRCVVCGKNTPKETLVRIVASSPSGATVDPTGKVPGRGTYVCEEGECLQGPVKRDRVEYALRTKITDEGWFGIVRALETRQQEE